MQRTWNLTKTREGKPKVTLYEGGRAVIARPVETVRKGNTLGRAWAESSES